MQPLELYLFWQKIGAAMAIKLPSLFTFTPTVCVLCGVDLSLSHATAGLTDSDGELIITCVSHLTDIDKLILGWADFTFTQAAVHKEAGYVTALY